MIATAVRPSAEAVEPRLTTTVAREHVHRAALSEVFLTGSYPAGPDTFTVTAQWPRRHSFFVAGHGLHDPLLLAETVRQSIPLLLHREYGVPHGYQFGWTSFAFRVRPEAMRVSRTPADIELRTVCDDIRRRGPLPSVMTMRTEVWRGEAVVGSAEMQVWSRSCEVYRRLRGRFADREAVFAAAPVPTPPVSAALVGRDRAHDVVLSPVDPPHRWRLRVDTSHPTLFDHALDHVPGALILEAVRQAALAAANGEWGALLTGIDTTFARYVEFDAPCWIDARPVAGRDAGTPEAVEVHGVQNGVTVFSATAFLAYARGL